MDYLKNKVFYKEVIKCQQEDKISEKLGEYFYILIKRVKRTYFTYTDPYISQDVESFAVMTCCEQYKKFDGTRSKNAFQWFTTVIRNGIKRGYKLNVHIMKSPKQEIVRYPEIIL